MSAPYAVEPPGSPNVASNLRSRQDRVPPMRKQSDEPDAFDGERIGYAWQFWNRQTAALRQRDREIEENVRFICGQQWIVWSSALQSFFDVERWLTEEEKMWRQRPVFNRILAWFVYNHARCTENPPILTFQPGPDAMDAELAAVMDIVWKYVWHAANMTDNNDRIMAWALAAGRAHAVSRVDLSRGPLREKVGRAQVPIINPLTQQPVLDEQGQPMFDVRDGVPIGPDGNALAIIDASNGQMMPTGEPDFEREGEIVVDVASPLEVRGEWGPQPWHLKKWHEMKSFLTPAEVLSRYGVSVQGDVRGVGADGTGELERLLFGSGFFGAANARPGSEASQTTLENEYVEVLSLWEAPREEPQEKRYAQTNENPGGRLLIVTKTKVLWDGPRPLPFPYTSPIRCWDFIRIPGRPSGSTTCEMLKGPQKAYNRGAAVLMEHRNLLASPIMVVDEGAGLAHTEITNAPGQRIGATPRPQVDPIQYVTPPAISGDVWRFQDWTLTELNELGNMQNSASLLPGRDASGELIKELRFNDDRYLGPFLRRAVEEYARMAEDWKVIIPALYDRERIFAIAGEDNVAETAAVYPDMVRQGNVNVMPDVESMLPEGRGERQQKVWRMFSEGVFGDPTSPEARDQYLELARFPHMSRALKQANPDRETASIQMGLIAAGNTDPTDPRLMIHPWYNIEVHVTVYRKFMASPKYLRLAPDVQQALAGRLQMLQGMLAQQQMQAQMAAMGMAPPPMPGTIGPGPGQPLGAAPAPGAMGGAPPAPMGMGGPPTADPSRRPQSVGDIPEPIPMPEMS